ncbi:MAG: putative DNA-binding domain-containing protein [Deltaproteobacteria bacterium]|nr:putative DNA-binding domain-containing protein [Deltaproteobacteria bacterium]
MVNARPLRIVRAQRVPEALSEVQRLFFRAISNFRFGRESMAQTAQRLVDPALIAADRWIVADDPADAHRRLGIYGEMYAVRLRDVLKQQFPTVAACLGEQRFAQLAERYLIAFPSQHGSVRYLGTHLARYLQQDQLCTRWPFLADLAGLEWARSVAIDAADAAQLDIAALSALDADHWPALRFAWVPSAALLCVDYPVHQIWRAVFEGGQDVPQQLAAEKTQLLVWRQELAVCHRTIAADEAAALIELGRGQPFAELCDALAEEGSVEQAALKLAPWLRRWVDAGVVTLSEQINAEGLLPSS